MNVRAHLHVLSVGYEANKGLRRHEAETHADALLQGIQFLLVNAKVHHKQKDGRKDRLALQSTANFYERVFYEKYPSSNTRV